MEHFLVGVSVIEVIKGDLCVCVLLYDAELSAFIAGEVYVVLLFEFFHSFFVCVVDNRPFLLGLWSFESELELFSRLEAVFIWSGGLLSEV